MTKAVNQLVNFFVPEHYDLTLDIDRTKRSFHGKVVIKGRQVADTILLHAHDLEVQSALIVSQGGGNVECEVIKRDNDEIELRPAKLISNKSDIVTLQLEFSGNILDESMHGLYPCRYELDGESRELLATQFESHHAREVFPCVDEPAAKATFDVTLTTETGVTVLGNMPVKHQREKTDKLMTTFETTPKMSTYLLAWVIGDLQRQTTTTKSGVEVNVYATPVQSAESLQFALDTAAKCIDFYDDYFGVVYPLPKSDHVALPDFSSGAMENWGLITYRETALLADSSAGVASRQYIATVVAHELSHQWFGNLTTMQWWNDLWLNESFASLMEHIATDALFPDWQMWQTFETSDVIAALRRDSLPGVQAVQHDVQHPDEISTLFDSAIVYAKGERLLKMLRAFIGEDNFRAGLGVYFQRFAYANTTTEDLWQCLEEASGQDIAGLMEPWLTRPGYPVVQASLAGDTVTLKQQRFFSDGTTDTTIWPIPLFTSDASAPLIMDQAEMQFQVADPETFQLNVGNNAHFITAYDEQLNHYLGDSVATMAPVDRAKLLNEALLLTQPGIVRTADMLDLLTAYADEDNDAVWDIMAMILGAIGRFVELDSEDERRLRRLSGQLARTQYTRLGWQAEQNESVNDSRLRPTVLSQTIFAEDPSAIEQALALYGQFKHQLATLDGDLRSIIMSAAVRYGEAEEFDYLLVEYKTSQNAELKQDIAAALTSTRDADRIRELLGLMDKIDIVKPQDLFYWYIWMLRSRRSRAKTWDWLVEHWSWIEKTFSGDKSYDLFPRYAGQILDNREYLDKYDAFFGPKVSAPALKRAIEIGSKDIASRAAWVGRDRAAVLAKLQDVVCD